MSRVVAFLVVLAFGLAAWGMAGSMPIHYTTNGDVQQTVYKPECNDVVTKFLGPKQAGRITAESYLEMVKELRVCGERFETPVAHE